MIGKFGHATMRDDVEILEVRQHAREGARVRLSRDAQPDPRVCL